MKVWTSSGMAPKLRERAQTRRRFPTATRVFLDPHRIEREDTRIFYSETRLEVIGMVGEQVLVVIYTPRADRIRIISARKANRRERRTYDTGKAAS